jgi:3'(2'), 5'-bisphosphate nucleotidase
MGTGNKYEPNLMYENILEVAIKASILAGQEILKVYQNNFEFDLKVDRSPITLADKRSNEVITDNLKTTAYPVLSEEGRSIPFSERKHWDYFWMVDPLDGTKEFIKRNGEFTVNIALIQKRKPILGVIYIPVQDMLYFASESTGAIRIDAPNKSGDDFTISNLMKVGQKLPLTPAKRPYTILGSKSHMNEETQKHIERQRDKYGEITILSKGSSLKICMVAEGNADEYPRFAPTMEWDIAAGHAIARYSGATIVNVSNGEELTYNSETLVNPWFIVKRQYADKENPKKIN